MVRRAVTPGASVPRRQAVDDADATVTTTREVLTTVVAGERTLDDAIDSGDLIVDGDADALRTIVDHLDVFLGGFPIVEP